jgi:5'-deoxynucleotidase YfbR-like HD superfamily hydrolase
LLHDASEAYISDINSPVKKLPQLNGYKEIEANIQKSIYIDLICLK